MRALVTGGYGYIGGHLVRSLIDKGWDVTILDSMFSSKPWSFSEGSQGNKCLLSASIVNSDAVNRAMHDVNIVFHLADRADWSDALGHPLRVFKTNTFGTAVVLNEARKAGVDNFVYASTSGVYGNIVNAAEQDPTYPISVHDNSKLGAEFVCNAFANLGGIETKVLRIFNAWGGRYSESVIQKFLFNSEPVVYGLGNQTRDFVHVYDVVRALYSAVSWDAGIYNIGTGDETTISGLWHLLRDDEPKIVETSPRPDQHEMVFRTCADMAATRARTSWEPGYRLVELSRERIKELHE